MNSIIEWFLPTPQTQQPAQVPQVGGSDYFANFYAKTAVGGPGEISQQTLAVIDRILLIQAR
jgi:hypothetical protein